MAEATDRPQGSGQGPPDAIMSKEDLGAVAPTTIETYQPLSLLAMAGFGLAVVYALVVLIGAAIALFSRIPWLMPYWTFLIPLAVLIVCGAARARIRNSEGTLSGLGFTTWGSRLAILVGLTYLAYYGFTFLAVRFQALDCADQFFEQIKQGHLEKAFLMAQGVPTKGMESSELRDMVESRFNQSRGRQGEVGAFSRFQQDSSVRFIEMDGDKAKISPRGVSEWEYSRGGYKVVLNYHVDTSFVEFDLKLETFGRDPKPGEPKGRQWQVNLASGVFTTIPDSKKMTPQGEDFLVKTLMAQTFVSAWIGKLNQAQWQDAYLDTLKPSERERLRKEKKSATPNPREELAKLIRIDDKTFWAGSKQREDIKKRVRNTFQLGASGHPTFSMSAQPQAMPFVQESEGQVKASFDVNLFYLDENAGVMQYSAEGRIVTSADSKDAADSGSTWRIEALDIDSGRIPVQPRPMQRASPNLPPPPDARPKP
jgi:hypothetical protein